MASFPYIAEESDYAFTITVEREGRNIQPSQKAISGSKKGRKQ